MEIKSVCVFCGSSMGFDPVYKLAAVSLAGEITRRGYRMVYGGSNVGLMKILADELVAAGKEVVGVMPRNLVEKEIAHAGITEMHIVESMAERKNLMVELSDCFIAMPGGFGTLDEFAEVVTYNQLRLTDKPAALMNVNGYFDKLLEFLDRAVTDGFLRKEHKSNLIVEERPAAIFDRMERYRPVEMGKWIEDLKNESR